MTHIYIAEIDTLCKTDVFMQKYEHIPIERKQKIDRLRDGGDKRRSLAAWLLFEHAAKKNGIEDLSLTYNEFGKPYLANCQDAFFSLSHSGNMVMCVISDTEVGCDIQHVAPIDLRIAERFFSAEEVKAMNESCDKEEFFFRLWALKESLAKAKGVPLASVSKERLEASGKDFFFKEISLNGYACAICSTNNEFTEPENVVI